MKTKCPNCKYIAKIHETLEGEKNPLEGEISLCINCGEFSEFENKSLKKLKIKTLHPDTKKSMKRIRDAWLQTQAMARLRK